jgi:type II secretory pathway pseudopilin PulG
MVDMKGVKNTDGFTIIEVTLFLAISAFLIIGLLMGVSTTVARHRYNDSVQDFVEFLRATYSSVVNVENPRFFRSDEPDICSPVAAFNIRDYLQGPSGNNYTLTPQGAQRMVDIYNAGLSGGGGASPLSTDVGKSNCLIYGKMLVFGADNSNLVRVYDLIGREYDFNSPYNSGGDLLSALYDIGIGIGISSQQLTVGVVPGSAAGSWRCVYRYVGGGITPSTYEPLWQSSIEHAVQAVGADGRRAEKTIMIVRSPLSGSVHTLVYDGIVDVARPENSGLVAGIQDGDQLRTGNNNNQAVCFHNNYLTGSGGGSGNIPIEGINIIPNNTNASNLASQINNFRLEEVNFCVGSEDTFAIGGLRRNVRIARDGRNATAVQLALLDVAFDAANAPEGNRCEL